MSEEMENDLGKVLKKYIDAILRLSDEKSAIQSEITEIYKKLKSSNINVKSVREIVRRMKLSPSDRYDFENSVDTYLGLIEK